MAKAMTDQEHSMDVINRAVAIIKPRQPYLDWAISIPGPGDDVTMDELRTDCTAIEIVIDAYCSEEQAMGWYYYPLASRGRRSYHGDGEPSSRDHYNHFTTVRMQRLGPVCTGQHTWIARSCARQEAPHVASSAHRATAPRPG